MILKPGTLLNDRYRILEVLGQGGMGSIYRARDENLDIDVAVKDNLLTSDEYTRQFRREATILATLRHAGLPRVSDHFQIEGQGQYMVMDFIDGEDLRQRMERKGIISEDEVVVIGAAICDALTYLCTREPQIIHRDIKPGNVKITPQGEIYLVDFGLAKTMQGSQATTTGARAMTPGYSPPEQYGTARTDMRSDIYSLGATLYSALTGYIPEDGLARAMDQAKLTPIRSHNQNLSKKVAAVIEKALELKPENRYQTPEQFKLALLAASSLPPARLSVFRVTPPPEPIKQDISSEELEGLLEHPIPIKSPEGAAGKSPVDSAGLNRSPPQRAANPQRKRVRTGCVVISAVMILIVGLGSVIYQQDPDFTRRMMVSMLVSPSVAPLPVEVTTSPIISPSATKQVTVQHDGLLLTSQTAILPMSILASVTNTPTRIPELPTRTMTAAPTPVGGGAGQIAYASETDGVPQIFIIRSDGSERKQITDISEGACQPDFSPSGDQIVFISPCDSSNDYYPGSSLYIINLDGTGLLPLPTMVGGDYDPAWSPDGQMIAFTSLRNNNRPQIYTLNLEDQTIKALSQKYLLDSQPSWSPDGKKILFVAERSGRQDIWVMDRDGQNQVQFTRTPNLIDLHPSFSAEGQDVLITQYVALGGVPRVVIAHFNLGDYVEYQIGKEKRPMRDAVMSPDGYWIAFEGWEAGSKHNIYLVTTTGISVLQVTDDPLMSFDPVWRPLPAN